MLEDDNGVFKISILNDLTQIQFTQDFEGDFGDSVYFNCNKEELKQIAEFILKLIEQ